LCRITNNFTSTSKSKDTGEKEGRRSNELAKKNIRADALLHPFYEAQIHRRLCSSLQTELKLERGRERERKRERGKRQLDFRSMPSPYPLEEVNSLMMCHETLPNADSLRIGKQIARINRAKENRKTLGKTHSPDPQQKWRERRRDVCKFPESYSRMQVAAGGYGDRSGEMSCEQRAFTRVEECMSTSRRIRGGRRGKKGKEIT
jgi:hypothetical protein